MHRFLVAILISLFVPAVAPVQAQVCQCIDVGDIKARITEANTAVSAYSNEMRKMVEQMQRTHEPIVYTPARRQKLQGHVQDALNQVASGRIPTAPTMGDNAGGTDNLCNMTINLHPSATACMRESVKRHEQHHRDACLKTRSVGAIAGSIVSGKDRFERDNASLVQYATEEIGGYSTELAFLQSELARLAQSEECNPKPKPRPELRDFTAQPRQGRTR